MAKIAGELEEVELVGDVSTVAAAVSACTALKPDVLLSESRFPDGDVAAILSQVAAQLDGQHPRCLVVSRDTRPEQVYRAVTIGALGYVGKELSPDPLREAVRQVVRGERAFDAVTAAALAQATTAVPLTRMELAVLTLVARGKDTRAVARKLGIADNTVSGHLQRTFRKLQVKNRTEAVAAAVARGLITTDPGPGRADAPRSTAAFPA